MDTAYGATGVSRLRRPGKVDDKMTPSRLSAIRRTWVTNRIANRWRKVRPPRGMEANLVIPELLSEIDRLVAQHSETLVIAEHLVTICETDGVFVTSVPSLHFASTFGPTREVAIARTREMIEGFLEAE